MTQSFSPQLQDQLNRMGAAINSQSRLIGNLRDTVSELKGIENVLGSLKVGRGMSGFGDAGGDPSYKRNAPMMKDPSGGGYLSLDQIPGRHIPYDFMARIPIIDGQPGLQQQTLYVSAEGPFVAVGRYAIFQSAHSFEVTDGEGNTSTYFGRSNGRFRPVSSSSDAMDAVKAFTQPSTYTQPYLGAVYDGTNTLAVGNPVGVNASSNTASLLHLLPNFPGNGIPINTSPQSMSAFRTMGFDGLISVETRGASFKRQETPVPSTFWTKRDGGIQNLATLDVFEPGEYVTISAEPQHPSNPAYGNIQANSYFNTGAGAFDYDPATGIAANNPSPPGLFPFLAGQYDGHEGIDGASRPGDTATTIDPVSRNASGILYIGYFGYRVIQPPAVSR
jgi:hypothetical protein